MKISRKNSKKIVTLLVVIILIIILFSFLNKAKDNKINRDNKNKNTIKTEELKKQELEKSKGKTSLGDATAVPGKSTEKATSADNKDITKQGKDEAAKAIDSQEGLSVTVKAANFGSTAEILIDSSKFNSSYKYYQYFLANEPISKVESISKKQTTIFPTQKAGNEVIVNLMGENKKVIKKINVKLSDKK